MPEVTTNTVHSIVPHFGELMYVTQKDEKNEQDKNNSSKYHKKSKKTRKHFKN